MVLRLTYLQPMRELFGRRVVKAFGSCALAGSLALGLYLVATPGQSVEVPSKVVSGPARVVDGDTIDVGGIRVRLEGIDAPERGQRCSHQWWGTWPAGKRASKALKRMIDGRSVTCRSRGRGSYGRMLGVCSAGGLELNAEMVKRGHAWAFVKYSQSYVSQERVAKTARKGIWQSSCRPAWLYREARWSNGAEAAPAGCAIKGNISRSGRRTYHMPWSPWYERTKIESRKGERWFCNEREAMQAGWKPYVPRG